MSTKSKASTRAPIGALLLCLAYLGTVPAANWAVSEYPQAPVGFGLAAPAGVYFAGLALILRDWLREAIGHLVTVSAVLAGTVISYVFADARLAAASAAAFLVSEALDYAVYEPLRKKRLVAALLASNAVGIAADSLLFLSLAFGSLQYLEGQLVGKAWVTLLAVAAIAAWRRSAAR